MKDIQLNSWGFYALIPAERHHPLMNMPLLGIFIWVLSGPALTAYSTSHILNTLKSWCMHDAGSKVGSSTRPHWMLPVAVIAVEWRAKSFFLTTKPTSLPDLGVISSSASLVMHIRAYAASCLCAFFSLGRKALDTYASSQQPTRDGNSCGPFVELCNQRQQWSLCFSSLVFPLPLNFFFHRLPTHSLIMSYLIFFWRAGLEQKWLCWSVEGTECLPLFKIHVSFQVLQGKSAITSARHGIIRTLRLKLRDLRKILSKLLGLTKVCAL